MECDAARDVFAANIKLARDATTALRVAQGDFSNEVGATQAEDFNALSAIAATSWLHWARARIATSLRREIAACHASDVARDVLARCLTAVAAIVDIEVARTLAAADLAEKADQVVGHEALLRRNYASA